MKRSGYADLPLHYGRVPPWLYERMGRLGRAVVESIAASYGKDEVLRRLSDPLWFQAFGCVLGMDWHSSGITTSVMGALKRALNPIARDLGLYICGGKGKHSRATPEELLAFADKTGLPGDALVRCSKLSAKVDNTAVQDGFQIYLHCFIVSDDGNWTVVQQGLNDSRGMARRYHWHSAAIGSFVEEPHTGVVGKNLGKILNLTDVKAVATRGSLVGIAREQPTRMLPEIQKAARGIVLPRGHAVRPADVDLKRLGAVLALAHVNDVQDFAALLLTRGLGPRTLQALVLVSEVIFGTPSRFDDPARFSFAHGGKDGHPFPVPTKVYDSTIAVLRDAVDKAGLGYYEKLHALRRLEKACERLEHVREPRADFEALVAREKRDSYAQGGRTVFGPAKAPSATEGSSENHSSHRTPHPHGNRPENDA